MGHYSFHRWSRCDLTSRYRFYQPVRVHQLLTYGVQYLLLGETRWVLDPQLASSTNHTTYDFTRSPTANPSQDVMFGAGYSNSDGVFGFLVADTVLIGGATAENFTFGVVNSSSQILLQQPYDGVLGLAYTPVNAST